MAKSRILCAYCDAKVTKAHAFCPKCKHPTMYASVEQRTAWELDQWTSKRSSPRKKVAAMAKPKRAQAVEQPAREVAAVSEPIKRVRMPRAIHPAVAARAARQAPAAASNEQISKEPITLVEEMRVIVLPEAVMTEPAPVVKKPVHAQKKAASPAAAPKRSEAEAKKEAAPKKVAASETTGSAPKPRRKAPKMAPMPVEAPAAQKNGNGNGVAHDATAEQIEILRELLHRVTAIEEKMTAQRPRARRFGLRKR